MEVEGINKDYLFKEGFTFILKKWSSFRIALDHNPRVLTQYADEAETVLEIDQMMGFVYDDICKELCKENGSRIAMTNITEILFSFIEEFFCIELQDSSEEQVAKCLCMLFKEIQADKYDYLERLRNNDKTINYGNYNISFPIKPEEKIKVIASEMEDMDIDDGDDSDDEDGSDEEEGKENTQNSQNNILNNTQNKTNEPDDEGFIVVKKGKKY